ncbi:MAG TPA: prenyltransferase [Bacteroidales bacterium]|nr:prenyltransferase [Bacteroidales bacterium]HRZ76920.1 prenyltransferase [Bacteroidales bacterium]
MTTAPRSRAIRAIKFMLFSATIVPSMVGGALGYYHGSFQWTDFLLVSFALLIGQAGGDYLYYYFTHRHTDARDAHTKIFAGWRPFFTEWLPREHGTLYAGILCLAIDLAIGIHYFLLLGPAVLWLALAGGLVAVLFTPLMLRGLKEPVVFLTFGPLSLMGIYLVLTGEPSLAPVLVSLPLAFLVTVVAYLKGARFELGQEGGDQVVLRLDRSRVIWLSALGYFSLLGLVLAGILPTLSLLGLLAFPLTLSVIRVVRRNSSKVQDYLWAVVRSIWALVVAGGFIALSLIL